MLHPCISIRHYQRQHDDLRRQQRPACTCTCRCARHDDTHHHHHHHHYTWCDRQRSRGDLSGNAQGGTRVSAPTTAASRELPRAPCVSSDDAPWGTLMVPVTRHHALWEQSSPNSIHTSHSMAVLVAQLEHSARPPPPSPFVPHIPAARVHSKSPYHALLSCLHVFCVVGSKRGLAPSRPP